MHSLYISQYIHNVILVHVFTLVVLTFKARKKNFGSGQLIFENWSGGPFFFFLNHNINIPNLIVEKVLKLEIQIKPVLI